MMETTENKSARNILEDFQKQKVSQESEVLLTAQRFINQYRALKLYKPAFLDKFNADLLSCSADVRRFFSSLMGGEEVRNYLEFLEKQIPASNTEKGQENSEIVQEGYLPSPEEDIKGNAAENIMSISKEEWQKMQEQQKLLMEQTQQLMKKMTQSSVDTRSYSEILDDDSNH